MLPSWIISTTHYVTAEILDLFDEWIRPLLDNYNQWCRAVALNAIRKLGRIVLSKNSFLYGKTYHKQTMCGAYSR